MHYEIKEIKKQPGETMWDYDQWFKILLDRLTFLDPICSTQGVVHCRTTSPYLSSTYPTKGDYSGRGGGDCDAPRSYTRRWRDISRIGASAIPSCKYDNAVARYGKGEGGARAHVWCTMCRSEGHHRDECPTLGNYLAMGAPNPFPTRPQTEWCNICRQWGHIPPHFPTLEKYQKTHHTPFCEFCKSMGHDVNNFRSLQLMQDHTHDVF
jgi:hypothetical protein